MIFKVAAGNLNKLFSGNIDKKSRQFWESKIDNIKKETTSWNWNDFNFDDFIQRLSFENVKKESIEKSIVESVDKKF